MAPLPTAFYERDAETVARALIGVTLLINGVGGPIMETEAYDTTDPGSKRQDRRHALVSADVRDIAVQ